MNKREFLKAGAALGAAGFMGIPTFGSNPPANGAFNSQDVLTDATGEYILPPLPYAYNALEPHIDEATMKLHHDVHHLGLGARTGFSWQRTFSARYFLEQHGSRPGEKKRRT